MSSFFDTNKRIKDYELHIYCNTNHNIHNLWNYRCYQNRNERFLRFIPIVSCALEIICNVISFYRVPRVIDTSKSLLQL